MWNIYTIDLSKDVNKENYYISNTLIEKIEENLKLNNKSILYLNRRWEFTSIICEDCDKIYKCKMCDISLSVHGTPDKLICHYCGWRESIPISCDNCQWNNLKKIGIWTQQIEKYINKKFSDANIFRADSDNVKTIKEKNEALELLKKADIIIGTKMITTWFDFENVWLIWVILLEQWLQLPFFDAEEKLYSNIRQLFGRWWRKWKKYDILVQTFIPNNPIIKIITSSNYKEFLIETLKERKSFDYPPFSELAILTYRDKNKEKARDFIELLKNKLDSIEKSNDLELTMNNTPFKRKNEYFYNIIVKWSDVRNFLKSIKREILLNPWLKVIFH